MEKTAIETKSGRVTRSELVGKYHGDGKSTVDLGEEYGVYPSTISDWLDKLGINARTAPNNMSYAPFRMHHGGYEVWRHYVDETHYRVRVHRLLAVAEHGFESVAGKDVHHKNNIPWDNRVGNLELVSKSEHIKKHRSEWDKKQRQVVSEQTTGEKNVNSELTKEDVIDIRRRYEDETAGEIQSSYDLSEQHIRRVANGVCWGHIPEGLE